MQLSRLQESAMNALVLCCILVVTAATTIGHSSYGMRYEMLDESDLCTGNIDAWGGFEPSYSSQLNEKGITTDICPNVSDSASCCSSLSYIAIEDHYLFVKNVAQTVLYGGILIGADQDNASVVNFCHDYKTYTDQVVLDNIDFWDHYCTQFNSLHDMFEDYLNRTLASSLGCDTALSEYIAGMLCLPCDPNWSDYYELDQMTPHKQRHLYTLSSDTEDWMGDKCQKICKMNTSIMSDWETYVNTFCNIDAYDPSSVPGMINSLSHSKCVNEHINRVQFDVDCSFEGTAEWITSNLQ
ncbi:hypothetical protein KIPB_006774, partial [Kipferlia bialata]|eukprot:g6774.t1